MMKISPGAAVFGTPSTGTAGAVDAPAQVAILRRILAYIGFC
jgi:hypothetical protein